jgi:hypothetical protein
LLFLDKKFTRLKMYGYGLKDFFMVNRDFGSVSKILNAE